MDYRDLVGEIPLRDIVSALDDDGDGQADDSAWASVEASADSRVADIFSGSVPAAQSGAATYAKKIFILEILFRRRGFSGDRNPYSAQAAEAEKRLRKLASGDEVPNAGGGGIFHSRPAKISNSEGNLF